MQGNPDYNHECHQPHAARSAHTPGKCYYIEINPRFGGGAPLSIKAGADSAEGVLRIINGEHVQYQKYAANDGAIYSRYDQSVCVQEGIKK